MHLELVELLRCPRPHAPGVLVAASYRTSERYVMEGVLGCPECSAEIVIRNGVTMFGEAESREAESREAESREAESREGAPAADVSGAALRVAAQLNMTDGRAVYALAGFPINVALAIRNIVPARLVLINAGPVNHLGELGQLFASAPAGVLQSPDLLPLNPRKFDGIALASSVSASVLEQAASALKSGGRLVAPAASVLPAGMTALVRDDVEWIATRDAVASAPVGITRRA